MTILRTIFLITLFTHSSQTLAGKIVDNGEYTTVNNLDWLDFTSTFGMTQTEALIQYSGWRAATVSDMKSMMESFFWMVELDWGENNNYWNLPYENAHFSPQGTYFRELFGEETMGHTSWATSEGHGLVGIDQGWSAGFGAGYTGPRGYASLNYSSHGSGIALVRDALIVNEPEALLMFTLGLAILLMARRNSI